MLSVLVVSPNPTVPGGVSVFIEAMKRHIAGSRVVSYYIGSPGKGGESTFAVLRRLLAAPFQLALLVRREKFDVVHINPTFDAKSLIRDGLLLLALRVAGFRQVLFYFHGWDFRLQRRILGHGFLQAVTAWVLNKACLVTVLGDDFRDGLVAMGVDPARITVTRTMFEGAGLKAAGDQPTLSARRFILFMSRFDGEKGGCELLQAFSVVGREYPDLDLVMAGDGADALFLRAQAETLNLQARVKFPGYVEGDDKWRLLRDCAIFALPTYYSVEGMPVVVLEAMGAGKPLLVGSAGALRSVVADPENGVVLTKVTDQTVEDGLRRLLSKEGFAASAGSHNRAIAWDKFEAQTVTGEIETYYRKVAQC
jgi:glycosyltransferase involved in cell wall biosynthesis